ncbi:AAA family ATPase [Candidatus Poribacteria bacterium]|nr:AAA family ATPase [Candidatus Poribacteria bacterium]
MAKTEELKIIQSEIDARFKGKLIIPPKDLGSWIDNHGCEKVRKAIWAASQKEGLKSPAGWIARGLAENYVEIINAEPPLVKQELAPTPTPEKQPDYTVEDFTKETGFPLEEVKQWWIALSRKKQIIFQGPPGTGKTFLAERMAKRIVSGTTGFWELVQFHLTYTYEDFIQGYSPTLVDGSLNFELKRGHFLGFCDRVKNEANGARCVLIIDEINRANLSRVFGELMYLLEYRDKPISPAAGGGRLQIPDNLYLIGTMNTADRSIALVDYALRRRFAFIRLYPRYDILERKLKEWDCPANDLIQVLKEINQAIGDRNYEVGISFFMTDKEQIKQNLPSIWTTEIEPYLEEHFYDQPDKVEDFRWENLSKNQLKSWAH